MLFFIGYESGTVLTGITTDTQCKYFIHVFVAELFHTEQSYIIYVHIYKVDGTKTTEANVLAEQALIT